jgi:hypothetical protein
MDTLDRETLVSLAKPTGWPSLSLYLPMHRAPRETAEDRIRLKVLLQQACERLTSEGMRDTDAENMLAPVSEMREDDSFWRTTADGLAIFVSSTGVRVLRLGTSMPEQVVVGDRFYLRPLVAAHLRHENRFYALALDKNGSRLFAGDRGSMEQLELLGAPTSEEDSAKYDEPTKLGVTAPLASRQKHAGAGSSGGMFPGHGAEPSYEKDQMNEYCRHVDAALIRRLGTAGDRPLVLLGTERLVAEYRSVSAYKPIAGAHVEGTTDYLTPQMIHERVVSAMEPYFEREVIGELASATESEGGDLVTRDAVEILEAAAVGRVRSLFFDENSGPFGTFDRENVEAKVLCDVEPRLLRENGDTAHVHNGECGWDLIDLALAETVLHDGDIHVFAGENAPLTGAVALLRY